MLEVYMLANKTMRLSDMGEQFLLFQEETTMYGQNFLFIYQNIYVEQLCFSVNKHAILRLNHWNFGNINESGALIWYLFCYFVY